MPRDLTKAEEAKVASGRKATRPSVYNPKGTSATQASTDFETWAILSSSSVKERTLQQIDTLLKQEADKDFQDLLSEALAQEKESLELKKNDLTEATSTFSSWRSDPGISGFEDVAEIGWLMQELQQGLNPTAEKEEVEHAEHLRQAVETRLPTSKESEASRETRLKAWIAAINAY